jgi:large conductance mechanosensitive channel
MKQIIKDFKLFASNGNMLDLAIGIIIGAAFQSVVESLSKDIIGDIIAAIGGAPDMSGWTIPFQKGKIHIGNFVGALINFLILAISLFGIIKIILHYKLANFKAQGTRECDYCKEFIPVDASRYKFCTSAIEPLEKD